MSILRQSKSIGSITMSQVQKPDTEGLGGMQQLWSEIGDKMPVLWQRYILWGLLRSVRCPSGGHLPKSKMQDRAATHWGDLYKMWQTTEMMR